MHTMKVELHNSLAFLYVLIEKIDKGIKTGTYHKPTCTVYLTKFSGFSPLCYNQNLANSLLHRYHAICNSYSQIEFVLPKKHFCRMNIHLASSTSGSGNFIIKNLLLGLLWFKRIPPNIFFKLLYPGNISHHVEKEFNDFIHKHLPDITFRFIHVTKNLK